MRKHVWVPGLAGVLWWGVASAQPSWLVTEQEAMQSRAAPAMPEAKAVPVPGAPRTNCIGTSPSGLGVFFRPERRFAGTETFSFKIIYPDGDIREVAAKIVIE